MSAGLARRPRAILVPLGPSRAEREARDAEALRESCPLLDPATGEVLSEVDACDLERYAEQLEDEELARGGLLRFYVLEAA